MKSAIFKQPSFYIAMASFFIGLFFILISFILIWLTSNNRYQMLPKYYMINGGNYL